MRKHLTFLIIAAALAQYACTRQHEDNADSENCDAAMGVYCKYADNDNLTVAYLGDLTIHGKDIDAVMLQAKDEAEWDLVRQDFDIMPPKKDTMGSIENVAICPDDANRVSIGVGIETDFLSVLGKDTLTSRDQITEEDVRKVSEYIAKQLRDILANFQGVDSVMPEAAIVIGDGPIAYNSDSISYSQYIDTVSAALTQSILEEYFIRCDSLSETCPPQNDQILSSAISHGHSGYVTAADYKNQAVWLFFYDDQEECNVILAHIREDIIINQ